MISFCQVSAFTETPGYGNQVGVVLDGAGLTDAQMQKFATQLEVPETVFMTKKEDETVWVRYFTPTGEIEFCGHATIAVGLVLATEEGWQGEELWLETLVGRIPLSLECEAGVPKRVWMTQRDLEVRPVDKSFRAQLAGALGIDQRMIHRGLPLMCASTGLWTLFVPLIDSLVVDALEPHMDQIAALSSVLGVSGVYPYAPVSPHTFYSRNFSPLVGIPEDPVTGSSAGALIASLAARGAIPRRGETAVGYCLQGHALGTPGEVTVRVHLEQEQVTEVQVGGAAVVEREGRF